MLNRLTAALGVSVLEQAGFGWPREWVFGGRANAAVLNWLAEGVCLQMKMAILEYPYLTPTNLILCENRQPK
jgi:hypothetical protein